MTDQLRDLLRDEADRVDVPPPPTAAILSGGRRARTVRRTRVVLVAAASVLAVVGGVVGVNRLVGDDARGSSPDPAAPARTPSSPDTRTSEPARTPTGGPLGVSGTGIGDQGFGAGAEEVVTAVTARFGEPDVSVEPTTYARVPGEAGWFEVAGDPLSPSWGYRVLSVSCWDTLCLFFGGADAESLRLRGWELGEYVRWTESGEAGDPAAPDVRLAGSGIRLGDPWPRVQAAYPDVTVGGGEGASVTIRDTPWAGIFDGVGEWRLSGQWDPARPTVAPEGARVTRLSGGEGPEPGCC